MNTVTIPTSTTGNGVSSSYTEERQSKKVAWNMTIVFLCAHDQSENGDIWDWGQANEDLRRWLFRYNYIYVLILMYLVLLHLE